MSLAHDIVTLGTFAVNDNGVPTVQAVIPLGDEDSDVETFGEIDMYQGLGLTSAPWPKDANGHAEGVVLRNCGNRDAVLVGARDTRSAKVAGALKPGDTVLHSTGPQEAAQLQLKEATRSAVLVTKGSDGKAMLLSLDGSQDSVQVLAFGNMFELTPEGITLTTGGASILIQGGTISLLGNVILGGSTPNPAQCIMVGPATGVVGTSGAAVPARGVWIGA